jgi:hypothetical protein
MLLYSPPDTDMQLPIGDDPLGGPDLVKVDQAAMLFYKYGHAARHAIFTGGQMVYVVDRMWFVCVRDTSGPAPIWVLYAVVDRATGVGQYKTEPISALEFAQALTDAGRTVLVRRYDNYEVTYSLDGESVPL